MFPFVSISSLSRVLSLDRRLSASPFSVPLSLLCSPLLSLQFLLFLVFHVFFSLALLFLQGTHFTASLKEVQSGKSYDLTITVPAGTPPGRYEEALLLHTNHPKFSKIPVGVNVLVMRDLHAFPESVDFKGSDLSILKQNPGLIDNLYENIIVENRRGDFEIKSIQTDVPFLKITQAPPSGRSSRFTLDIQVLKEKLAPGKISGSIRIATDVKEFPEITIPVVAEIE